LTAIVVVAAVAVIDYFRSRKALIVMIAKRDLRSSEISQAKEEIILKFH